MIRKMQYAGLFYPNSPDILQKSMEDFFTQAKTAQKNSHKNSSDTMQFSEIPARICMLPHAGHIYSGLVTAKTLLEITLPKKLIVLCPNHTGLGKHGAVWDKGGFETPLGTVPIDEDLAKKLLSFPYFVSEYSAHVREHSAEVILPFLQYRMDKDFSIVPISLMSTENLAQMAEAVSQIMADDDGTGLLISSDMNHFAAEQENKRKDFLALDAIKKLDENVLLQTVMRHDISMCGVLGAYIGILAAKAAGLRECRIAGYDTSASASGDSSRVVGYAGLYFI